ncbi:unnamed protein product [Amoebophrya sp. A120]|nr:unnamed protein product [Amoebophrya sp. A120]|eukprot:GSA120T00001926001.1
MSKTFHEGGRGEGPRTPGVSFEIEPDAFATENQQADGATGIVPRPRNSFIATPQHQDENQTDLAHHDAELSIKLYVDDKRRQVWLMSLLFGVAHACVTTPLGYATSVLGTKVGSTGNAFLYVASMVSSLCVATVARAKLGTKGALVVGSCSFAFYVLFFGIATMIVATQRLALAASKGGGSSASDESGSTSSMFLVGWSSGEELPLVLHSVGSIIGGLASGIIWVSQGSFIATATEVTALALAAAPKEGGKTLPAGEVDVVDPFAKLSQEFASLFSMIYLVCEVFFKVASTGLLFFVGESPALRGGVFAAYGLMALACMVGMHFLLDKNIERKFSPTAAQEQGLLEAGPLLDGARRPSQVREVKLTVFPDSSTSTGGNKDSSRSRGSRADPGGASSSSRASKQDQLELAQNQDRDYVTQAGQNEDDPSSVAAEIMNNYDDGSSPRARRAAGKISEQVTLQEPDAAVQEREEKERDEVPKQEPRWTTAAFSAIQLMFSDPRVWFLMWVNVTFGVSVPFLNGWVNNKITTPLIGSNWIGTLSALTPVTAAICSRIYGSAFSQSPWVPLLIAAVCFAAQPVVIFLKLYEGNAWIVVALYLLQGAARATYESTNKGVWTTLYGKTTKKDAAFANIMIQTCATTAIFFFLDASVSDESQKDAMGITELSAAFLILPCYFIAVHCKCWGRQRDATDGPHEESTTPRGGTPWWISAQMYVDRTYHLRQNPNGPGFVPELQLLPQPGDSEASSSREQGAMLDEDFSPASAIPRKTPKKDRKTKTQTHTKSKDHRMLQRGLLNRNERTRKELEPRASSS